ncbi:MAG: HAD family hydrolase [Nocardioides sp.]
MILDFDGPVTTLMPPPANLVAADRAREPLKGIALSEDVRETTDHLAVLRWTLETHPSRLLEVESACTAAEVECARISPKSPEIDWLLERAEQHALLIGVASNNSENSVRTFLDRFGWEFAALACRTPESVRLMKPNPAFVLTAAEWLGIPPTSAVFVGDSVSDVMAGRAAGTAFIGIAKTDQRRIQLASAGAKVVLERR